MNNVVVDELAMAESACRHAGMKIQELQAILGQEERSGVALIAMERRRQITMEGYTPEHDDEHVKGEMSAAANSYTIHAHGVVAGWPEKALQDVPLIAWPWAPEVFKPDGDAIRNLQKAGALIAAEIDRLQRLKMKAALLAAEAAKKSSRGDAENAEKV